MPATRARWLAYARETSHCLDIWPALAVTPSFLPDAVVLDDIGRPEIDVSPEQGIAKGSRIQVPSLPIKSPARNGPGSRMRARAASTCSHRFQSSTPRTRPSRR